MAKKQPSEPAIEKPPPVLDETADEIEEHEPVEIPLSPAAGVRALRDRIVAESKRGTAKLTKALTLLEAEYERVLKVTGAADVARLREPESPPEDGGGKKSPQPKV